MYKNYLKRMLDFTLSLLSIIVLSPIILLVAILVKINMGGPILFKQQRPGLNKTIFMVYKFRSMTNEKDKNGNYLPVEKRITRFGKLLRSTSADELPQLLNILKGDMAIVGPRPLRVEYLMLYDEKQSMRHDVRPGLTDLSATRGRSNVSWEDQFKHDLEYINNLSFLLDIKIILLTIITVIKREGVSQDGHVTREAFKGTNKA